LNYHVFKYPYYRESLNLIRLVSVIGLGAAFFLNID